MPTAELTVDEHRSTHRERKKQATRMAIHGAALDLAEAHGLSGTTVEAISERAGVAPRTFWSYFPSKEAAVINLDPARPEHLRIALLARPEGEDPLTALQRVLEDDLERRLLDKEDSLRRGRLARQEPNLMATVAAHFDQIEQALVSAVAERTGLNPDKDLYPRVVVTAACGACRVAQVRWRGQRNEPGLTDFLDQAFKQLSAGLCWPPRSARIDLTRASKP